MKSFTVQEQSTVYIHTYTSPSESLAGLYFSLNWETELGTSIIFYIIYSFNNIEKTTNPITFF